MDDKDGITADAWWSPYSGSSSDRTKQEDGRDETSDDADNDGLCGCETPGSPNGALTARIGDLIPAEVRARLEKSLKQ